MEGGTGDLGSYDKNTNLTMPIRPGIAGVTLYSYLPLHVTRLRQFISSFLFFPGIWTRIQTLSLLLPPSPRLNCLTWVPWVHLAALNTVSVIQGYRSCSIENVRDTPTSVQ